MLKSVGKILVLLSIISLTNLATFNYGFNLGMIHIENKLGPALYMCISLLQRK